MAQKSGKLNRAVFLSFEYHQDRERRTRFVNDAEKHCDFALIDMSLPSAVHDVRWQREAKERIRKSRVVIVLLGRATQNAPGVEDELSLAGELKRPVVQLMPKGENHGLVAKHQAVCAYDWDLINEMLRSPKVFANNPANHGK